MGFGDRWDRKNRSEENAGKPLGGGVDARPAPISGKATLSGLSIAKPVTREGRTGLSVRFTLHTESLAGDRLVLETSLHEQIKGPLKSSVPTLADSLGNVGTFEIFTPADDEPASSEQSAFFPFAAIEVDGAGKHRCFARVRVLEERRGVMAEEEIGFELTAG